MTADAIAKTVTQVPTRLNLALAGAVALLYLGFFFGGIALLRSGYPVSFSALVLAFVVATPTLWGLIHEGIHGRLLAGPRPNRALSRVLCILLGFSFDAVQFGHLMHHRYNGHEYDRPERMTANEPAWKGWLRYGLHLFGGHY